MESRGGAAVDFASLRVATKTYAGRSRIPPGLLELEIMGIQV